MITVMSYLKCQIFLSFGVPVGYLTIRCSDVAEKPSFSKPVRALNAELTVTIRPHGSF